MIKILSIFFIFLLACSAQKPIVKPAPKINLTPQQMQKKMLEASAVTFRHELLHSMQGTWKVESKFWMNPKKAPEISKGTAKNTLVLGGRFVRQEFSSKMMGKKFTGIGYTGYDNLKKAYVSNWMDNFSTQIMQSQGYYNVKQNAIVFRGKIDCPYKKQQIATREVLKFVNKKHMIFTMFMTSPGKPEVKSFEIKYTKN
jgi:hypothetical protein